MNSIAQINVYQVPGLEAEIKKTIAETEQLLPIRAQRDALENSPPLINTDIGPYWLEYHLTYQSQVDDVGKRIPAEPLRQEITEHQQQTDRELQTLNNHLAKAKEEGFAKDKALSATPKPHISKRKIVVAMSVLAGIFLVDAVVTAPAFQNTGFNLIECFCIAAGIAVILYFAAHYFEPTIKKGRTPLQQRLIAGAFIAGVLIMSVTIGVIRAIYFKGQTDNHNYMPILFIIFSLGSFGLGVGVRHYQLPKPEQYKALRDYEAFLKTKQDHDAKTERIVQEIKAITDKNYEVQTVNRSILKFGQDLEQFIISSAHRGLEIWKRENVLHRPDKNRPKSFDSTKYPLEFKTYFLQASPTIS